ncbi:MAG: type transport system permease protein [Gaiellaceae bacterium]|jgi:ABC-2 type transport system permease protein|nr:type transport system permease protein [Gaiellaceae bacterium]
MSLLRMLAVGWLVNMKSLMRSGLFVFTSLIEPLIFATLTYFLFKAGHQQVTVLYSALGAGMMGIWSSTLFGSGGAISWQRWQGTLELIVAAPPPLIVILFPLTLATASIGLYSLAATLLWDKLLFGLPFHLAHPLSFVVAVPAMILGLGALGLVIGSGFVLYRNANALSNMLEFPIWLVTGVLVPLSLLPGWVSPIGWILSPTWGFRAVRGAALGGDVAGPLLLCLGLAVVYVGLAAWLVRLVERLARERAQLALA